MIEWYVALTPLLVLPILLLFRFVGCDIVFGLTGGSYGELLLNVSSLVAYWRLGDLNDDPQAKDEKGLHHGVYGEPPATGPNPPSQAGSGEARQGEPGLIKGETERKSVDFQGGYVVVPFASALNTPSFTVEAWVFPGDWQAGNHHVVVESAEFDGSTVRGFSMVALWNDVQQKAFWSAALGTPAAVVTISGPEVKSPPTKTYLALTYDAASSTATFYVATRADDWDLQFTQSVPDYQPVQSNSLYIGAVHVALPVEPLPPPAPPVDFPFIGRIQEVALYKEAISRHLLEGHRQVGISGL
jgi:hypothetical protein